MAEAKKEVQQELNHVRALTSDREDIMKSAVRQVEEMREELADALHAVTAAETRAAVAEVWSCLSHCPVNCLFLFLHFNF